MSLLVCVPNRDNTKLMQKLTELLPDTKIEQWPEVENLAEVEVVLAWNAPTSLWSQLPNLRLVQSYGAGVDSIDLEALPQHVPVARIVDPNLAKDMAEYVLTHVLAHKLRLKQYFAQQQQQIWKPNRSHAFNRVGILGFGELGRAVAMQLLLNGFEVRAWANSEKHYDNVLCFVGQKGYLEVISQSDYVVCLLPLTTQTQGILNQATFSAMPNHAVLINVARGKHVNEQDLLSALDSEEIAGATLDVFAKEPLPAEHPFWHHKKITVTPHAAALTCLNTAVKQIADNVVNAMTGKEIAHVVDKKRGY